MTTITVVGIRAALIEQANRASFYGINKLFGDLHDTAPGRQAAHDAVHDWMEANHIEWNSFYIHTARTIDTTRTKTPYQAEIDFSYD